MTTNTIAIHSGLICSWTDSTALVIDSLSGDRISSFTTTAAFSAVQKQQSSFSPKIVFVASSPPYALTPAASTASIKKKNSAGFASPSASFSAVLMILVRIEEEASSNLSAVFVAAETGELLGMTKVPVPSANNANGKILHASLAPVFPSSYQRHRSLYAARKLAWVVHFSSGLLQVGVFDKKNRSSSINDTTALSQSCLAFAFSVDVDSKQTLLHHLESANNNKEVTLKEHSFNYVTSSNNKNDNDDEEENNQEQQQNNATFNFSWESQALNKDAATSLTSSFAKNQNIFLLTDSREAMNGKLSCFAVCGGQSPAIVCVTLTPESTASYQWKISPSSSNSSSFTLEDARLIEKPNDSKNNKNGINSVGVVAVSKENVVGVAWIEFNVETYVPNKQLKETWTSSSLSGGEEKKGKKSVSITSSSSSVFVSPNTSSPFEISSMSDSTMYLTKLSSNNTASNSTLLQTNLVAFSTDSKGTTSIVVDTTDINGEEDASLALFFNQEEENAFPWTVTRDLIVASENQQQELDILITLRISTTANRAEMDLAEWLKFHVMGEYLTKVASIKPQVLFLHQQNTDNNNNTSSTRWPSPVLRVALRNLGGDVVKTLASGLINNFLLVAKISRNKTTETSTPTSYTFALASAVKVIESCVIMQRSLGVNFDSIVEPFCKKLSDLENHWSNTGTIGHRVASISALTTATNENGIVSSAAKKGSLENSVTTQLYFDTKVGGNQQMSASVSTATMDDVCLVVSNLKKQYKVPGDLF